MPKTTNLVMRSTEILFAALLPLTLVSYAQEVAPGRAECTFDARKVQSVRTLWRELSTNAERLTPSTDAVSAPARRRAVAQPKGGFNSKNFIDDEIFGRMLKDGIVWTRIASDEEFLRRVTLDLTGQIPDPDTVKAFLADTSATKRDAAIDRLLASEAFVDRWTMWFGDLVRNVAFATNTLEFFEGRDAYYRFIHDSFAANKPYDQMVREQLAGVGKTHTRGEANYWVRNIQNNGPIQDTYDNLSANSGEIFLGLPLICLSCHNGFGHLELVNSGLSKRTRNDFWKNAAFFSQVTVTVARVTDDTREYDIQDNSTGAYRLNTISGNKTPRQPAEGQPAVAEPAFFLSAETPRPGEPRRQAYARILTAQPQFARATVNYLWKEMFGLGIVEPADSFDLLRQDPAQLLPGATLQPTHPALLTKLADQFVASGYDFRAFLRLLVTSNAYQLSSRYTGGPWNETWTPYFARHYPHRLMAEAMLDSIFIATGVGGTLGVGEFGSVPRAMMLPDPIEGRPFSQFLNTFGRGDRDDEKRSNQSSITQALLLMNDRTITDRIKARTPGSTVQKLTSSTTNKGEIVDGLYLATLSRFPTPAERSAAVDYLSGGDLAQRAEDLQYALLNRVEFLFN